MWHIGGSESDHSACWGPDINDRDLESTSDDVETALETAYVPPLVVDLGTVRDQTLGSSGNGTADANSQYYWG